MNIHNATDKKTVAAVAAEQDSTADTRKKHEQHSESHHVAAGTSDNILQTVTLQDARVHLQLTGARAFVITPDHQLLHRSQRLSENV